MVAAEPGLRATPTTGPAEPAPAPLAPIPVRPRRLVYLGTPAMAVPPLQALVTSGWDVALVVTGADAWRGGTAMAGVPR